MTDENKRLVTENYDLKSQMADLRHGNQQQLHLLNEILVRADEKDRNELLRDLSSASVNLYDANKPRERTEADRVREFSYMLEYMCPVLQDAM